MNPQTPTTDFERTDEFAPPEAARMRRVGVAAAKELREVVRTALGGLFEDFLRQLPGALLDGVQKLSATEQRARQDLARTVPANATRWLERFVQGVDANLVGNIPIAEDRDAAFGAGAEDYMAFANVELRAEAMHHLAIVELDAKLDRVRQNIYLPIYTKALAPAGLFRALQDTCEALGATIAQRRVMFNMFERLVVSRLGQIYKSLQDALTHIDTRAARAAEEPPPPTAPEPPSMPFPETAERPALGRTAPAPSEGRRAMPKQVDADTISMLRAYARTASRDGYNDGALASELLALHENKPMPGVTQDKRWVPLQRITLAGLFLNEAIADPLVSPELRPQQESVRFPLVKSALTDSTLFTNVTHPLRSLVNDLMLKSATARITGDVESRRMAELLQQVLVQFDLAPDFVREAMLNAHPIDEAQVQRFFELQKQQAQERREAVINEAKRLVVRQLELSTFGRNVPAPAVTFLNGAWGPLLIKRLLQFGASDVRWKEGLGMMEQLLDELDLRTPGSPPSEEWRKLTQAMDEALAKEGLTPDRVKEAMQGLAEAWSSR